MKRISIFLAITFILTWAYEFGVVYPISSGALVGVPPVAAQFATGAAMFFPALGVLITRLVTREGFKNSLIKPRGFKKSLRGSSSPGSVPPCWPPSAVPCA